MQPYNEKGKEECITIHHSLDFLVTTCVKSAIFMYIRCQHCGVSLHWLWNGNDYQADKNKAVLCNLLTHTV